MFTIYEAFCALTAGCLIRIFSIKKKYAHIGIHIFHYIFRYGGLIICFLWCMILSKITPEVFSFKNPLLLYVYVVASTHFACLITTTYLFIKKTQTGREKEHIEHYLVRYKHLRRFVSIFVLMNMASCLLFVVVDGYDLALFSLQMSFLFWVIGVSLHIIEYPYRGT